LTIAHVGGLCKPKRSPEIQVTTDARLGNPAYNKTGMPWIERLPSGCVPDELD